MKKNCQGNNSKIGPISAELNRLREVQATGQLLVALGGAIAFIALIRQIPLYALQAQAIQRLTERVDRLERKCGCDHVERPY